jgi:hypothetical protein
MPVGGSPEPLELGSFTLSMGVKDISVSVAFYQKLGFAQVGGDLEQSWVVMQNGATKIGLFQGFFEGNSLTFNPGWDSDRQTPGDFTDVRELQRTLKQRGVSLDTEADESRDDGPAHFELVDPDGNHILVDQHVPRPRAAVADQTLTEAELKFFANYGYVVKRNVLDRELCAHARDRMWAFAGPTRLSRDDPSSWVGPFTEADTEGSSPASHRGNYTWKLRAPGGEAKILELMAVGCRPLAEQLLGEGPRGPFTTPVRISLCSRPDCPRIALRC